MLCKSILKASAYMRICFVSACMHQQVSWVPCVHADMYYMCGMAVGMDVEFVKLVCVWHRLDPTTGGE